MGLFSILLRSFNSPTRSRQRFDAAPLSPRRLERRRVLDAAAASLLLGPTGAGDFVQVGENVDSSGSVPDPTVGASSASANTPPTVISLLNIAPEILEFGLARLELQFEDPDVGDIHTIEIDWGDGTVDTITLLNGQREISVIHPYFDDTPTGPTELPYSVQIKVTDSDGAFATTETEVLVRNVAPSLGVLPVATIDEGGNAQLYVFVLDRGIQDTQTIEVDWGDGTTDTYNLPSGRFFLNAQHQYLDDMPTGPSEVSYAINVVVTDDDGGVATAETSVLVKNVAPSNLQVITAATIDENSFAQLQINFDDPGVLDLHSIEIDWGDGTIETISLPVGERFLLVNHQYLDDMPTGPGELSYAINVKVTDDDGGVATAKTSVLVRNVAPKIDSIFLSKSQIDEGNWVTVTGTFSDASILDTHTVYVQWGDGSTDVAMITNANGAGTFEATNFYADNDTVNPDDGPIPDNLYTVAVTVVDDDGGEYTKTIDLTVLNVSPTLDPIIEATDVNAQGETFLTISFSDPGADTLTVYVDWGDVRNPNDPSMRALQPYVIDLTGMDGPGTFTVTLPHTYSGPPNPNNPAADIDIYVYVADDDFGDGVIAAGQSEIRMATIQNPGIGDQPVYIDTTPQVPRLIFPSRVQNFLVQATSTDEGSRQGSSLRAAASDNNATTERFLELQVADAEGNFGEGHRLNSKVLNDLPQLFRSLPDGHYEIYLVHTETNTRRLVIAVHIRNGTVIDPGDDSDGTRDRPPTNEAFRQPEEAFEAPESHQNDVPDAEPKAPRETPQENSSLPATEIHRVDAERFATPNWGLAVVGLAATKPFRSWAQQVDRSVAQADAQKWRKLRLRNPNSRKNQ
ncbi:MAG: hypothetical protein GXP26_08410 [Planctomycetes bacterium]|nr:hypothetical protein [Planctomycetota bacterium]